MGRPDYDTSLLRAAGNLTAAALESHGEHDALEIGMRMALELRSRCIAIAFAERAKETASRG